MNWKGTITSGGRVSTAIVQLQAGIAAWEILVRIAFHTCRALPGRIRRWLFMLILESNGEEVPW